MSVPEFVVNVVFVESSSQYSPSPPECVPLPLSYIATKCFMFRLVSSYMYICVMLSINVFLYVVSDVVNVKSAVAMFPS